MKNILKRIIAVICVMALFIACGKIFRYILVNDTKSYTRIMMHQLYESEENIDVLFVGSSHVYRSLIPKITDEGFGAYTFNAGTSGQAMDGSLAIIREAIEYHDVDKIYLEMYYGVATEGAYEDRTEMTPTYIISDYMKPSFRKVQYLLNASSKEHWSNSFNVARRSWTNISDPDYIKRLINLKSKDSYKNYEWVKTEKQTEYYVDRGFVANDEVVAENEYWNSEAYWPINISKISDDYRKSLQDIIDLCDKKGIELVLFVSPMPEWTIVGKGNYDEYSEIVRKIAEDSDIKYYDFNLCKQEYFSTTEREYFMDEDHLNTKGAELFSNLFCEFFAGQISEQELFYESLSKKIEDEEPIVYGVAGPNLRKDDDIYDARIIANRSDGIEYRIVAVSETDGERVIQDYSKNTKFSFLAEEEGILQIYWRTIENPEKVGLIELEYGQTD